MASAARPLKPAERQSGLRRGGQSTGQVNPWLAAIRESRWFLWAVAAQLRDRLVVCSLAGRDALVRPIDAYETILGAAVVFGTMALAGEVFRRRLRIPPSVPPILAYRRLWASLHAELLTSEYLATVALTFAIAPLALSVSSTKQAIPTLNPFTWDKLIAAIDAELHGGFQLWRVLQPLLGHPAITVLLDWFYHRVWTALLLAIFVFTALMQPSNLRRRFLLSFVLIWLVVGNLFALAMASAGPAYYRVVSPGHGDPYAGLFAYLRSVDTQTPLLSFRGEHVLWSAYAQHTKGFGFGVSAMPSVHVATAALVALFGFGLSRTMGAMLSAVALCTFVASVALGWHYAFDGYVGAVLAAGIWWFAGRVTRGGRRLPAIVGSQDKPRLSSMLVSEPTSRP